MEKILYKTETFEITESTRVASNCNAITFIQSGAAAFKVNQVEIPATAGAFFTVEGNANEMDVTEYRVDFGSSTTSKCTIVKKLYLS